MGTGAEILGAVRIGDVVDIGANAVRLRARGWPLWCTRSNAVRHHGHDAPPCQLLRLWATVLLWWVVLLASSVVQMLAVAPLALLVATIAASLLLMTWRKRSAGHRASRWPVFNSEIRCDAAPLQQVRNDFCYVINSRLRMYCKGYGSI